MKKMTGVLINLFNYQCLKQARKRRGEAGREVGSGGEGLRGVGRGGEGSDTQLKNKTIALVNS